MLTSLEDLDTKLVVELSKRLKREWAVKGTLMKLESERNSRALCENRKSIDGIGRPRLEVPTDDYHRWGQKFGYECWRDEGFLKSYERKNPQCVVKAVGTKTLFGFRDSGSKRLVKKYT